MCLSASNVKAAAQWNWEGDTIIHDPIIRACREVLGTKIRYDIDIRDFITSKDNAVLGRAVGQVADMLAPNDRTLFFSRQKHSFDLRLRAVTAYLSKHIAYEANDSAQRKYDYWLFPDETLRIGSGDCEDRAFLLASLLLASGVSSYSVRVALGKIYDQTNRISYDHVWVMYKNESGVWMLIEPLLHTRTAGAHARRLAAKKKKTGEATTVEYIPYYVFNDTHLWKLKSNTTSTTFEQYLDSRAFWNKYDPKFAAGVHNHIFDAALPHLSETDLLYVKAVSLAMDLNPVIYDPRDHFDNGFIDEGWQLVEDRVGEGTLEGLAKAAHAAADFYAHSSYGYFAKKNAVGRLVLYDHDDPDKCFATEPDYSQGGFALSNFSVNESKCDGPTCSKAIKAWNAKNISGRFGQPGDQAQGFLERVGITIPYKYRSAPDYAKRTCLPHHNEIAVDDEKKPDKHKLYTDPVDFNKAFQLRKEAAIEHIGKLYEEWVKKKGK